MSVLIALWRFRYLIGIASVALSLGGLYAKGRYDEHQYFKAKIESQKQEAIKKGHQGAIDALKKLDSDTIPGYWWRD